MRLSRQAFVAFVLFAVMAAPAVAVGSSKSAAARAEHQRVERFWTAERRASARSRDFVSTKSGFQPAAGKASGAVTGASWNKSGVVATAVGKVYFSMDGSNWQCSGSVATDNRSDYSLVLTAGHCAYDETKGAFATNWMFIPAWGSAPSQNCAQTTYGCWTASALVVHQGFATAGGFNTQATLHDFAFAVVGPGGKSGTAQLDATAGSFGLVPPNSVANGTKMYAFGYPAGGKYAPGNVLTYCAGKIVQDMWNGNGTWGIACDMTGGSSGGGWFKNFNEATGVGLLGSLNSYRYSGLKNMYGPKFNSDTQDVYTSADGATANTIVP